MRATPARRAIASTVKPCGPLSSASSSRAAMTMRRRVSSVAI
jgi:hypothetical protein